MNLLSFLFANKIGGNSDPLWFIAVVSGMSILLILLGIFSAKLFSKEKHQALYKTLKKSSGWLKGAGITYLILLWFRLESLRFFSMKFWWLLVTLLFVFIAALKVRYYLDLKNRIHKGNQVRA